VFHPRFAFLFNSYYVAAGPRHARPKRGLITRPDAAEVAAYRAHVDAAVERLIAEADTPALAEILRVLEIGLNHEEQHQELIVTDVTHLFSRNPARPALFGGDDHRRESVPLQWIGCPAGIVHIGHAGEAFAFDNEGLRHRVWLEPFELASRPVSNAEFIAFIDDGGYRRPELWLSLGWDAVTARGWTAPLYWNFDGRWRAFGPHGMTDVDPHAPVRHISLFEADAYARWADARLPTEFEWEVLAGRSVDVGTRSSLGPHAHAAAASVAGLLGPRPVIGARADWRIGDVWEWTSSSYAPYPGFRPSPGAIGEYNGKFMCNQYVLRGASVATAPSHARVTYRNFFPADTRWQFCGVQLARDAR